MTDSYQDTLLAVIPLAQRFARDMLGVDGIYLPVELGPWGTVCSMLFHNQKTYASFCCVNLFMRYYMTLDVNMRGQCFRLSSRRRFSGSAICAMKTARMSTMRIVRTRR